MTELPQSWQIEIERRSVAMLSTGAPALKREKALEVYDQLLAAIAQAKGRHPPDG